jgi:YesN/AraC family two-component response regulator
MYKLLIVDDEPKIRKGLRYGYPWEEIGYVVAGEAANGLEALDFIAVCQVDVILTDVRMPVFSGIDLVMRLREESNRVKVILLSGYREFEYAQKAIQYGVYSYLVKPTVYDNVISIFGQLRDILNRERKDIPGVIYEKQPKDGFYKKIINSIYSYVDNNISNASLEGAARTVDKSIYYLSRLFKQHTGQNFSDYVMAKKMEHAASLLSGCRYKIHEISSLLGYDSPKNFSRAFRAYYGKPPRDYRDNPQSGDDVPL